jgi:ribosomal protein S18 acetylase RimI-like enzyme
MEYECPQVMRSTRTRIRPFVVADYQGARALWERTEGMGLNESDTQAAIESFLKRNPGFSAIAIAHDGEVVGAVLCGHDGRRGFLNHLAVAKTRRGQGIARRLMEFCFARLAAAGIPRCNIFVYDENGAGTKFWVHNGWSEVTWKTLQKRVQA